MKSGDEELFDDDGYDIDVDDVAWGPHGRKFQMGDENNFDDGGSGSWETVSGSSGEYTREELVGAARFATEEARRAAAARREAEPLQKPGRPKLAARTDDSITLQLGYPGKETELPPERCWQLSFKKENDGDYVTTQSQKGKLTIRVNDLQPGTKYTFRTRIGRIGSGNQVADWGPYSVESSYGTTGISPPPNAQHKAKDAVKDDQASNTSKKSRRKAKTQKSTETDEARRKREEAEAEEERRRAEMIRLAAEQLAQQEAEELDKILHSVDKKDGQENGLLNAQTGDKTSRNVDSPGSVTVDDSSTNSKIKSKKQRQKENRRARKQAEEEQQLQQTSNVPIKTEDASPLISNATVKPPNILPTSSDTNTINHYRSYGQQNVMPPQNQQQQITQQQQRIPLHQNVQPGMRPRMPNMHQQPMAHPLHQRNVQPSTQGHIAQHSVHSSQTPLTRDQTLQNQFQPMQQHRLQMQRQVQSREVDAMATQIGMFGSTQRQQSQTQNQRHVQYNATHSPHQQRVQASPIQSQQQQMQGFPGSASGLPTSHRGLSSHVNNVAPNSSALTHDVRKKIGTVGSSNSSHQQQHQSQQQLQDSFFPLSSLLANISLEGGLDVTDTSGTITPSSNLGASRQTLGNASVSLTNGAVSGSQSRHPAASSAAMSLHPNNTSSGQQSFDGSQSQTNGLSNSSFSGLGYGLWGTTPLDLGNSIWSTNATTQHQNGTQGDATR